MRLIEINCLTSLFFLYHIYNLKLMIFVSHSDLVINVLLGSASGSALFTFFEVVYSNSVNAYKFKY